MQHHSETHNVTAVYVLQTYSALSPVMVLCSMETAHNVMVRFEDWQQPKPAINLACTDFLGLGNDPDVQARARQTVQQYGVGSCGPRGFYGTFDVHLQLEEALAKFMGQEECIIYSYDIATVSSVIPAFASRPDILILDEGVSFPIQQGAKLSRARVHWFKHNDVADLAKVLAKVEAAEAKER